jgi:F-type H+-transporting ATPase subunit b
MTTHLWSLGFQVVNFLLLLFLLHRYLWKPVRATIDARRKEIDDAAAGVKARDQADEERRAVANEKADAADRERARLLVSTAAQLAKDRDQVLADARAVTDAERRAAQAQLALERGQAAKDLTDATLDASVTLAGKLLGEVRGAAVTEAFLDRIYEHLDGLPPAELAKLRAQVAETPTIQVATAPALAGAGKAAVQARLTTYFGPAVQSAFLIDDALIAGAELRFSSARLGHSFQHGLRAARRALTGSVDPDAAHPELTTHGEIVDK